MTDLVDSAVAIYIRRHQVLVCDDLRFPSGKPFALSHKQEKAVAMTDRGTHFEQFV